MIGVVDMTATERLRELLDARCVKYYKHEDDEPAAARWLDPACVLFESEEASK